MSPFTRYIRALTDWLLCRGGEPEPLPLTVPTRGQLVRVSRQSTKIDPDLVEFSEAVAARAEASRARTVQTLDRVLGDRDGLDGVSVRAIVVGDRLPVLNVLEPYITGETTYSKKTRFYLIVEIIRWIGGAGRQR